MIGGVFASLCTPFTSRGELDVDGLVALVAFGLESGCDGFLVNAIAGEVGELTTDERRSVEAVVLREVEGRVPVIVGIASGDEDATALSLARDAVEHGAKGILVPARSPGDEARSVRFARLLADAVDVEIMLQEAPRYSEASYGLSGLGQLAALLPRPLLVKVEGGSWQLERVHAALDGTVAIWGGDGGLYLLECLRAGAVGVIPGIEVIDRLVAAYRAESAGEAALADRTLLGVLPFLVFAMQSQARYVAAAKWVLQRRGLIASTSARVRGAALTHGQTKALDRIVELFDLGALGDVKTAGEEPRS